MAKENKTNAKKPKEEKAKVESSKAPQEHVEILVTFTHAHSSPVSPSNSSISCLY